MIAVQQISLFRAHYNKKRKTLYGSVPETNARIQNNSTKKITEIIKKLDLSREGYRTLAKNLVSFIKYIWKIWIHHLRIHNCEKNNNEAHENNFTNCIKSNVCKLIYCTATSRFEACQKLHVS